MEAAQWGWHSAMVRLAEAGAKRDLEGDVSFSFVFFIHPFVHSSRAFIFFLHRLTAVDCRLMIAVVGCLPPRQMLEVAHKFKLLYQSLDVGEEVEFEEALADWCSIDGDGDDDSEDDDGSEEAQEEE